MWWFPCSTSFTYWHPVPSTSLQMMVFEVFKSTSRAWGNGSCSSFLPRLISTSAAGAAIHVRCSSNMQSSPRPACVPTLCWCCSTTWLGPPHCSWPGLITPWDDFPWTPLPKWLLAYFYPCTLESPPVSQHWMHSGYVFTCPLIYYLSLPWVHLLHLGGDRPLVHWCSLYLGEEHIVGSP